MTLSRFHRLGLTAAAALIAATSAQAADLDNLQALSQAEFRALSEDLGSALSYKGLVPAESLGIVGFDIGVAATGTTLKNRAILAKAADGSSVPKTLPVTTVRAVKGLPFDLDIGVAVGTVPGTDLRVAGGELRWAILPGSTLMPALALRAAVSSISGVDQLKLRTTSLDLSISKGFLMFTPYAGVGVVQVSAELKDAAALATERERFKQDKVFAGVNLNLGLMNIAVEGDKTGDASSYGLKLGLRF
ncbi:MAG: hypothetical protein L6Q75_15265 [Burkholderiaceae bacterium]|nr:hypothetical protein [Burkholderiaceae bacterium]